MKVLYYLSSFKNKLYDLGKALVSVCHSDDIGLYMGQFIYSDEDGAEEFLA
jgi:hypothetical protein